MNPSTISTKFWTPNLPTQVLFSALFGIIVGLFFGDYAAILRPLGAIYVQLLQVVVLPYIICTLLLGLGRLTPQDAKMLLKKGWVIYLLLLLVTFAAIMALSAAIPINTAGIPSPVMTTQAPPPLVETLVSSNIFHALAYNYVPAVVIFCVLFGITLQSASIKKPLFKVLDVIHEVCLLFWKWLVRLAPIAIFALIADTFGTIKLSQLTDFAEYITLFFIGTLVLTFWIYPAIISCLIPLEYKQILKGMRSALIIAAATTLSVVALPFIYQFTSDLIKKAKIEDENTENIINTNLLVSYPFGQFGNFFIVLFMLFSAVYFNYSISTYHQTALPFLTFLSSIGSPSTAVSAVTFLSDWMNLPAQNTNLYISMTPITRYGQVLASVMAFASLTILTTFAYYNQLRIRSQRLVLHLIIFAIFLAGIYLITKDILPNPGVNIYRLLDASKINPELRNSVKVTMLPPTDESKITEETNPQERLYQIQKTGILRVGYNPNMKPFVFFNKYNQLVGYDVDMMYHLAKELHLQIYFIPFTWPNLVPDILANQFDVAIGGIYVTENRLQSIAFTDPYNRSNVSFIVPQNRKHEFQDANQIRKITGLRIGTFDDPVLIPIIKQNFPNAQLVILNDFSSNGIAKAFAENATDVIFWSQNQTDIWALGHPGYISVTPQFVASPFLMAYMLQRTSPQFLHFLNYWLALKKNEGLQDKLNNRWLLARPEIEQQPRWSILHNVLHWY